MGKKRKRTFEPSVQLLNHLWRLGSSSSLMFHLVPSQAGLKKRLRGRLPAGVHYTVIRKSLLNNALIYSYLPLSPTPIPESWKSQLILGAAGVNKPSSVPQSGGSWVPSHPLTTPPHLTRKVKAGQLQSCQVTLGEEAVLSM